MLVHRWLNPPYSVLHAHEGVWLYEKLKHADSENPLHGDYMNKDIPYHKDNDGDTIQVQGGQEQSFARG